MSAQKFVTKLAAVAGVTVNGSEPWDIQVHDERFYGRVLRGGSLALGESYLDGWWDAPALDELIFKITSARLDQKIRGSWILRAQLLTAWFSNRQAGAHAWDIGPAHYDRGNDLYQAMLDSRLTYSSGYWKNATTLDAAQEAKLDLVCRKLYLRPGLRVLDIGCGWGSFAKFAAERYGVSVVGITVSKEQWALAHKLCAGLPIELKLQDYRALGGTFDRIVSMGMLEHVGPKNYRTYFDVARRVLTDDGLFLLHTIGDLGSHQAIDPWINKYIFPNAVLPSAKQITAGSEGLFVLEDWHNFGADYDRTLMAWFKNFDAHWPELMARYDERFYRMWKYYLLSSAGSVRSRLLQLWQIVLSPRGVRGRYQSLR